MGIFLPARAWFAIVCLVFPFIGDAQSATAFFRPVTVSAGFPKELFETDEVLNIQLSGNIRQLLSDRGKVSQYHPLTLSYTIDSQSVSMPVRLKTRGHFRKDKANCSYPPLWINVSKKDQPRSSIFYNQDKIKLVMPCQDDEYIIREWLVYRLYNLITPKSFRARLVKLELNDERGKKKPGFYGILLENEIKMAQRNKYLLVNKLNVRPEKTDPHSFLAMAVFEYMIGNTDWSVQYLQNIKLLATDSFSMPLAVPYDFDHAGIVSAPYAQPAEELVLRSVRERRYRGYCITDMRWFEPVVALFNRLKKDIYEVYTHCSLLDAKYLKSTIAYLDEFYATINNPKALQKAFGYPCDPNGTGNVVIKGLRTGD
jgi:hypothetical protein